MRKEISLEALPAHIESLVGKDSLIAVKKVWKSVVHLPKSNREAQKDENPDAERKDGKSTPIPHFFQPHINPSSD